jgi:lysyl-tRNA synthetase class 2
MAENNNVLNDTSELKIRRDKLNALYESGKNPFEITKYEVTHTSVNAIAEFSAN